MPYCPNCHEIYFGSPDSCSFCFYDFRLGRVVSKQEREVAEEQNRIAQETRDRVIAQNPQYEYTTAYLSDSIGGFLEKDSLEKTLHDYASAGWKLHSVIVNEAGKNASSIGFGGVISGTNSTIDVTILIFERCVKLAGQ